MQTVSLYDGFLAARREHPDRPALTFLDAGLGARTYTYRELFDDVVEPLASAIQQQGLDTSAPLGILLRSQEHQTVHYLAALAAGVVPAILTPPNRKLNRDYYHETMAAVLRRSDFAAVVAEEDLQDLPVPTLLPYSLERVGAETPGPQRGGPLRDRSAFLQFSSGTTGIKRGVLVTDAAAAAQIRTYADALGLSGDDTIVSWLPLYHDMGFVACLNMPLFCGVHTVMLDPLAWVADPATFIRAASDYRATLSWNPNFAFAFMAQRVGDADVAGCDLSPFRALVNCSEPATYASQAQFLDRFRPLGLRPDVFTGCYAMAETTFAVTHGTNSQEEGLDAAGPRGAARAGDADPYVSVGRPLEGVEIRVTGESGKALGEHEIGELWVRSPFNFSGYYNDAEATAGAFSGSWYRTGDLGYRAGAELYVIGRRKDVLIVGGVNVFPQDLEEVVGRVDGIQPGRVSAFSYFDARLQTERIVVLAESTLGESEGQQAVMRIRQRLLASFQIANFRVHLVPPGWLVKSSSGKMARSANRSKWLDGNVVTSAHSSVGAS